MRILSFENGEERSIGLAVEGGIVDCGRRGTTRDLFELLQGEGIESLRPYCSEPPDLGFDEIRYRPLIANPAARFLCIGINYRPHMREMGREEPPHPVVFVRFASSQVGHGEPLIRPAASEQFDFEGELAVVIGKAASKVPNKSALEHIAGYSCFNDGSVRDFQSHSGQFTPGKNFTASGSFGPWLVTSDEIPDPAALELETRLNGEVMQNESTGELIFGIPELVEYISSWTELVPGDVIVTGTPGGVGAGRKPPRWMQAGDTIEVEISGVGCLSNPVSADDSSS